MSGKIFVVTGMNGSGKTSRIVPGVVSVLKERYPERQIVSFGVPTQLYYSAMSVIGVTDPVKRAIVELMAHALDNYRFMNTCLSLALNGVIVVTDRWWTDGYVYDYANLLTNGISEDVVMGILNEVYLDSSVVIHDSGVICDIPAEVAVERMVERDGSSRYSKEYMEIVRKRYTEFCVKHFGYEVVDAADTDGAITRIADKFSGCGGHM